MYQHILKIDGMHCSMCESHVNSQVRDHIDRAIVVRSSHLKGTCRVLSDRPIAESEFLKALDGSGYRLESCSQEEKKDTFSYRFHLRHYHSPQKR